MWTSKYHYLMCNSRIHNWRESKKAGGNRIEFRKSNVIVSRKACIPNKFQYKQSLNLRLQLGQIQIQIQIQIQMVF